MKKRVGYFVIVVCAVAIGWACSETITPYTKEPKVRMRFFNEDSLAKVKEVLTLYQDSVDLVNTNITSEKAQLKSISDSLIVIIRLISSGQTDLTSTENALRIQQDSVKAIIDSLNTRKTNLTDTQSQLNTVASNIQNGKVLLAQVDANGNTLKFTDSATYFYVPINMNRDTSAYMLTLGNKKYALTITYSLSEQVNEKSYLALTANNIAIIDSGTFKKANVYCPSNRECSNDKATINLYF